MLKEALTVKNKTTASVDKQQQITLTSESKSDQPVSVLQPILRHPAPPRPTLPAPRPLYMLGIVRSCCLSCASAVASATADAASLPSFLRSSSRSTNLSSRSMRTTRCCCGPPSGSRPLLSRGTARLSMRRNLGASLASASIYSQLVGGGEAFRLGTWDLGAKGWRGGLYHQPIPNPQSPIPNPKSQIPKGWRGRPSPPLPSPDGGGGAPPLPLAPLAG